MLIEFRCGNYSRFDKTTGQYQVCGQRMEADADDAGLLVTCPRCSKECEVPFPEKGDSNRRSQGTGEEGQGGSAKPSNGDSPVQSQLPSSTAAPVAGAPKLDRERCVKCGGNLNAKGVCKKCRWVRPRFDKANMSLDEMPMAPAGMMLWFANIMSEGVPLRMLGLFANIAVPFCLIGLMAFSLLVIGGIFGGFCFLLAFVSLLLFGGLVFKAYQFLRDGNARLAWFQKPFWFGILCWCRSRKWEGIDASTRNRNIIDHRGDPITDASFAELKGLKTVQVLDLEGTMITDESIKLLYQAKHLQCLVVRNTKVTHLAVTRLQQSFPKMWIWH
jgi:hypothetical protein